MQCTDDGRFLLKIHSYGSRLAPVHDTAIIYKTATWKEIWQADLHSVVMSPDGKTLAVPRLDTPMLELRKGPAVFVLE